MKKFHVSRSFEQHFIDFDVESPIDIPTLDSFETLWEWMKYWKSETTFVSACHFYKLPDSDDYEFAMYQIISTSYASYNGSEPVRTVCSVKNIVAINDAISIYRNKQTTSDLIIIPRAGIYPSSPVLIEPIKTIDVPFYEVEQQIAYRLC